MAERAPLSAASAGPEPAAGARLTIDPAAVVRNWRHLAAFPPPAAARW